MKKIIEEKLSPEELKRREKRRAYAHSWYEKNYKKNREEILIRNRQYRLENREKNRAYSRLYRLKNKEKIRIQNHQHRLENREKYRAYSRSYYLKNKEKIRVHKHQHHLKNREKYRERNRVYCRLNKEKIRVHKHQYYLKNREKKREKHRAYYRLNKEKMRIQGHKYYLKNREKKRIRERQYHANNLNARLAMNLRSRLYGAIIDQLALKRGHLKDLIGTTIPNLRLHLEKQFKPGMSWKNYGRWHTDHIRPLASFDLSKLSEQKKAMNYKNLQPLWKKDNLSKGAKFDLQDVSML